MNTINSKELEQCSAMDSNGFCKICSCKWDFHIHITYKTYSVIKQVKDKNIEKALNSNLDSAHKINSAIKILEEQIESLKAEQLKINEISAKFAIFAEKNSILTFNDDMVNYLDLLIRQESDKKAISGSISDDDDGVLKGLIETRQSYFEQKAIFKNAYENVKNCTELELSSIDALKKTILNLPTQGKYIKKIIQTISSSKENIDKTNEIKIEKFNQKIIDKIKQMNQ